MNSTNASSTVTSIEKTTIISMELICWTCACAAGISGPGQPKFLSWSIIGEPPLRVLIPWPLRPPTAFSKFTPAMYFVRSYVSPPVLVPSLADAISKSIRFHVWLDCILTSLGIGRPSQRSGTRSVSESLPYASVTHLGSNPADCPYILTGYYHWSRSLPGFPQTLSRKGWYCQALGVPRKKVSPPEELPPPE